jgi:hypothetical protein|tara:strand:- start:1940 stop:2869 length:930 start_codon:yes stop_codon:yes gene_type:complete
MTDQVQDMDLELEEENVEEAHDPKTAEDQSVASVKAAETKGKKAKGRKGDKQNAEKSDLKQVTAESVEIDADFSDDLNALVEGEATLSEEFKEKTAVIFEAALRSKVASEINRLEEAYAVELEEEVSATKADLVEKVDSYLNYVVENWMTENKLAIQTGLRAEIAEGFMNGLKDLFVESYIEVPESKVDIVDDLAEQVEDLEAKLNKSTAQAIEVSEELESYKREAVIREAAKDLAETQVEKLKNLAGDIDFVNEDTFARKVATIKESYFTKTPTGTVTEEVEEMEGDSIVETSDAMARYVTAIKQASK